jgi:hypothetical protein
MEWIGALGRVISAVGAWCVVEFAPGAHDESMSDYWDSYDAASLMHAIPTVDEEAEWMTLLLSA